MILQQNNMFWSGHLDSQAMSALSYFMRITVIILCSTSTRLLLLQNVDFTFRSSDLVHNIYLLALACQDCKFVDSVTSAKLDKHLGIRFRSVLYSHLLLSRLFMLSCHMARLTFSCFLDKSGSSVGFVYTRHWTLHKWSSEIRKVK